MRKGYKVTISINKKKLKPLKKLSKKKIYKNEPDQSISRGIEITKNHINNENIRRQERIGKTLVEVKNEILDIENEKKERLRKRRRIILSIILVLIIFLLYIICTYGPIIGISMFSKEELSEETKIDIVSSDEDIYENYCEELLVYNNRKLTTYNNNSKVTWEYTLQEVFTPEIYINGKYMAVVNKTNGTIYLFYNKKELLTKNIEGTISNVYINSNGNFAVEYSTSGYKKIIGMYNKNGDVLYNTYLQVSSIIDIKFLDNKDRLLVITADATSFNMNSVINIVDNSINDSKIKELTRFENSLIYDAVVQGNSVILMLNDRIVNCNLNTGNISEITKFDSSQILFISLAKNYYVSVEKELDSEEYNINTLRLDNTNISKTAVNNSPKIVKNSGYLNYFIYQDNVQVLNKWGVQIKNFEINFPPKRVVILNKEKCLALIYSNKIYFVNI